MSSLNKVLCSKTWLAYREVLFYMYVWVREIWFFCEGIGKISEKFIFCAIPFLALGFEMP